MSGRWLLPLLPLIGSLVLVTTAMAAPPPPELIAPAPGESVVIPTFEWYPVEGAARCEIQVADNARFAPTAWEAETRNAIITPVRSLPNAPLWWRVRCLDEAGQAGAWSAAVDFTKQIPAPEIIAPAAGQAVVVPTFEWYPVAGATSYWVEVAADRAFTDLVWQERTCASTVTPVSALPNQPLWWRVRGRDSADHDGTPSAVTAFIKAIPAPEPIAPVAQTIIVPTFEWYGVPGAAYYQVQVAADSAFTELLWEERTYATAVSPVDTLPNGRLWWRVQGRDADDQGGMLSVTTEFTKAIVAPEPITPLPDDTVDVPAFEWYPVEGAAAYAIQVAADPGFTELVWETVTPNATVVPVEPLPAGQLWWRVRGQDADEHAGTYSAVVGFVQAVGEPCDAAALELQAPDDGDAQPTDPAFEWDCLPGATSYRLLIYRDTELYDRVRTEHTRYVPYSAPNVREETYADGSYTWKVEAYNRSNERLATSSTQQFTKAADLALYAPDDRAGLGQAPAFFWQPVVGATHYTLEVYQGTRLFDRVRTAYPTYTPYRAPNVKEETYANGTYTWKVEAYDHSNTLLTTSGNRWRFSLAAGFDLYAPDDGASFGNDPTLQWQPLVGAHRYKVLVYAGSELYDRITTAYPQYTPYAAPNVKAETYAGGTYTWQVEAYGRSNQLLTPSSGQWQFSRAPDLALYAPEDGAALSGDPTFDWQPVAGAQRYRVVVYREGEVYDRATTDYATYTPYRAPNVKEETYDGGAYTWQVEAYGRSNQLLAVSEQSSFRRE